MEALPVPTPAPADSVAGSAPSPESPPADSAPPPASKFLEILAARLNGGGGHEGCMGHGVEEEDGGGGGVAVDAAGGVTLGVGARGEASTIVRTEAVEGKAGPTAEDLDAVATIKRFQGLQEDRVATYKAFDQVFAELLEAGDFSAYQAVVREVTKVFSRVSASIRQCEAQLRDVGAGAAADLVRCVQEEERGKLRLVANMQVLRQKQHALAAAGDGPGIEAALASVEADIEEGKAALGSTMSAINDALEELRYEAADLELPTVDAE